MKANGYEANTLTICLIAGESSGDILGGKLMVALKKLSDRPIQFVGIGGDSMRNEGLEVFFPIDDLAVMGISEVVPYIPRLLKRIKHTCDKIETQNPDAVVTIDSPGFSLRVAKKLKHSNTRLIHYVAPTVWAWKSWRAKKISKFLDKILTLFKFETEYFEAVGLNSVFVGHPILESGAAEGNGPDFRSTNGIPHDKKLLCILPGSRLTEVRNHLPIIQNTLELLSKKSPDFFLVLPLVSHVADDVKRIVKGWPYKVIFIESNNHARKYDAFAASDVAIACSGTVALELALADTPYVTIYKMSWMSSMVAKIFVKVPYVNIINILLNREVVPELLLRNCKPHLILPKLTQVLTDIEIQKKQRKDFREALDMLAIPGVTPSERAARAILEMLTKV